MEAAAAAAAAADPAADDNGRFLVTADALEAPSRPPEAAICSLLRSATGIALNRSS